MNKELFEQYTELFLTYLRVDLKRSPHTCRAYATDLELIKEFWQTPEYHEVAFTKVIYRYLHDRLHHKNIDKKSMARKISCINSFSKFLARHDIILDISLQRPLIHNPTPDYLTVTEINTLLNSPDEKLPSHHPCRDKAILELLYATGIRPSELIAIKIGDINIEQKVILIRNTRKKERGVIFGDKAAQQITKYIERERNPICSSQEHLFLNQQGDPLTTRSIQRICNMFGTLLEKNRVLTPSLLRHSCAVHLLQEGSQLELVYELLGTTRISAEKYLPLTQRTCEK